MTYIFNFLKSVGLILFYFTGVGGLKVVFLFSTVLVFLAGAYIYELNPVIGLLSAPVIAFAWYKTVDICIEALFKTEADKEANKALDIIVKKELMRDFRFFMGCVFIGSLTFLILAAIPVLGAAANPIYMLSGLSNWESFSMAFDSLKEVIAYLLVTMITSGIACKVLGLIIRKNEGTQEVTGIDNAWTHYKF